jgi:hypothetical protein
VDDHCEELVVANLYPIAVLGCDLGRLFFARTNGNRRP